ncbi:MAG: hypothetical protein MZV64_03365 [Ignavibacteriales bacterium]|nr:hypothetical protein [Ignavibacteriales bacterium]
MQRTMDLFIAKLVGFFRTLPEFETFTFSLETSAQQEEKSVIETSAKNIFIEFFIVILFCFSRKHNGFIKLSKRIFR